MKLDNLYSN